MDNIPVMAPQPRSARIKKAELENAQLRKLVVALLLEKAQLEEKLLKPNASGQ